MIRHRLISLYTRLITCCFSNSSFYPSNEWSIAQNSEFADFASFINTHVKYVPEMIAIERSAQKHKWVGAQYLNGTIFAIPNDEARVLMFGGGINYIQNIKEGLFKWTGGCVWDDSVYCFPRTSNSFLRIRDDRVEEISLSMRYDKEHHYSGVCTKDGIVYQPPRNTNHILKTDLKTGVSSRIRIAEDKYKVPFRYCGSIIHPNGYIYLFPECNNKVIRLDPNTDQWCFIGNNISTMCFDAKIGLDGNIYGYSAYCNGIMKIDIYKDKVSMIHGEITPGAYGTKYGIDGCLYSVPGDGSKIYMFDVLNDKVEVLCELNSGMKAKYAGGVTNRNGEIVCVPAEENSLLVYRFNDVKVIPESIYDFFYLDNY